MRVSGRVSGDVREQIRASDVQRGARLRELLPARLSEFGSRRRSFFEFVELRVLINFPPFAFRDASLGWACFQLAGFP